MGCACMAQSEGDLHALFEEGGSNPNPVKAQGTVLHHSNRDLYPGWILKLAAGYAVQAGLQGA